MVTERVVLPNFRLHYCIGKACEGEADVLLAARNEEARTALAVRVCCLDEASTTLEQLAEEVAVLKTLRHENVLPLRDSFIFDCNLVLVFPLVDYGSVTDLIHAKYPFGLPEAVAAAILRDVLAAVAYLRSQSIVHRAIRCSHMLLSSKGSSCLTGFRNATSLIRKGRRVNRIHDFSPTFRRNLLWLAPEILRQDVDGYGLNSDIYSVGVAACEMSNGFPPFADMEHMQMLLEKLRGTTPKLLDWHTLEHDTEAHAEQRLRKFSWNFHHLVEMCMKANAADRLPPDELGQHAFFRQARKCKQPLADALLPVKPLSLPSANGVKGMPPRTVVSAVADDPL